MSRKVAHVISHSHWDREWYMPYERHHVRLVELMDTLLQLLEQDPQFRSFHLDGQTIMLEDYLQVRPERRETVVRFVREGRLQIGPWYILQDEFLTSSEANIRNLLTGFRDAKEFGAVCRVGYFPDSFGNIGQAPQILLQAGIDTSVFGRGVKPTGFNNAVIDSEQYESPYSEMYWESQDGSRVLAILFANWYHNAMVIPSNPEQAKAFWAQKRAAAERFASTSHLLFMNGCDHQPVQTDLSAALETARSVVPDMEFHHSDFPGYIAALKERLPKGLSTIRGELRSQRTNGWGTLVNTASARVYIKQANQHGQAMLEKVAEPLAAFAMLTGRPYPHHLFTYAWKTLMQNHPHDSICGCSDDEVHREMMTRFAKSCRVAEEIVEESASAIAEHVDTTVFTAYGERAIPFVVFNTSGWNRTNAISVDLEVAREPLKYGKRDEIIDRLQRISVPSGIVIDAEGQPVSATVEDLGTQFGYELPKDQFRQSYFARRIRVTLLAGSVPMLGYAAFAWLPGGGGLEAAEMTSTETEAEHVLENEFLFVRIRFDGTLELRDKRTGRIFSGLNAYEDTGDIGNEYIYRQPEDDRTLTTVDLSAEIELLECSAIRTVYAVVHRWELPESADERFPVEIQRFVPIRERKAQRSRKTVPATLRTEISLESGVPYIKVKTTLGNKAKDHRLRVLFPTDTAASVHFADSIFEVARRDNEPAAEWTNPSNCQHQQAFVHAGDAQGGLTIASLGLNEYELLRDGRNTIAVTLLRAVAELGDWGVFPTPEAQCLGEHTFEFAIIPNTSEVDATDAFVHAYQYQIPWIVRQMPVQQGSLPARHSFIRWSGQSLALTAVKAGEGSDDLILRWFNMTNQAVVLNMDVSLGTLTWDKSNVMEDKLGTLAQTNDQTLAVPVRRAEIVTLRGSRKR